MSKRVPYEVSAPAPDAPVYFTSFEDLESQLDRAPEYKSRLDAHSAQEFPAGVTDAIDPVTRRTFISLMGASIGLASLEACRRPVDHILPYTRLPSDITVGVPNHYASVYDRGGDAIGVVVSSFEGRPTKIEGNPDHSGSHGGTDLRTQASILDLYDPDRARQPSQQGADKSYADFDAALTAELALHEADGGAGMYFLSPPTLSPTFIALRTRVRAKYPRAVFLTWGATHTTQARAGTQLAFGQPFTVLPHYDRADVIVSLDCDFLQTEPGAVRANHEFSAGRRLTGTDSRLNRLYVIEPVISTTGSNADHRLRIAARDVEGYLKALGAALGASGGLDLGTLGPGLQGAAAPAGVDAKWINAVAQDLVANRGKSLLVVGLKQPARVHALAHALNAALGNAGQTVDYVPVVDAEESAPEDLAKFAQALAQGDAVKTLFVLGGNPSYDLPGDVDFHSHLSTVRFSVQLSSHRDETSFGTKWHVPRAHYLESWGDQRALDGTVAIQQPLIAPLFHGRSDLELLDQVASGGTFRRGFLIVRESFAAVSGAGTNTVEIERAWRRVLHDGRLGERTLPVNNVQVRTAEIASQLQAATPAGRALGAQNLEVVFLPDIKMLDGRHANNSWLMELPDPLTKIVWDNAAYLSPRTASELGVVSGDMLSLSVGGKEASIVAWVMPALTDYSIGLTLGWGRTHAGRIGSRRGFNVNPLRTLTGGFFRDGVQARKTGERHPISQTQEHHKMVDRPLAIEATFEQYKALPHFASHQSPTPRTLPLWREVDYSHNVKWGMVIDLTTCTGCNACAIACQSENNVPVVGKEQVSKGREMHWLRIDRYFVGTRHEATHEDVVEAEPHVAFQPVMCVQCEEAPCENVCPVNATAHSPEGLNEMAYNRCIGTRYCSNNCPYKVRRFNYLNWHNDGVWQSEDPDTHRSDGDVPETLRMMQNPNVTVRFRGVMEKCTYCVQRIRTTQQAAHAANRGVQANEVVTACAQACPTHAITFGDLNKPESNVTRLANNDRRYKLLAELGTQPRTTYLAKVRNPNPAMPDPNRNTESQG